MLKRQCKIYDAGLSGCFILWGRREKREDYVSRIPVQPFGCVYASDMGYVVREGKQGQYDVVSVWPSLQAAMRRAAQVH